MYTNLVIDISHYQANVNFEQVAKEPVVAVISKASYGTSGIDKSYPFHESDAKKNNLLWGAYHFGTGEGTGQEQAQKFLKATRFSESTTDLIALDFEPNVDANGNPLGPTMTIDQARGFVSQIVDKVGRYPLIYSNHFLTAQLQGATDSVLSKCPLWIAEYMVSSIAVPRVPNGWANWTLWQYTDGAVGQRPHTVLGIGGCDRDYYIGSPEDLKSKWPLS
jgi:lysozyme